MHPYILQGFYEKRVGMHLVIPTVLVWPYHPYLCKFLVGFYTLTEITEHGKWATTECLRGVVTKLWLLTDMQPLENTVQHRIIKWTARPKISIYVTGSEKPGICDRLWEKGPFGVFHQNWVFSMYRYLCVEHNGENFKKNMDHKPSYDHFCELGSECQFSEKKRRLY